MSTISVELPIETEKRLKEMAERLGVELEELIKLSLSGLARSPDPEDSKLIDRILSKNEELYERLS